MSAIGVLAAVRGHAADRPDHPAAKDLDVELTYAGLVDEVARVAQGLAHRGVAESDRVCLFLPNSVDFVVASLATLWIGAIFVPLATTDPVARVDSLLDDCRPTVVVVADPVDGDPPQRDDFGAHRAVSMAVLRASVGTAPALDDAERLAYAIYTSGTTGSPKGVLIGTGAFAAAVGATVTVLGLGVDTRTLCVSPFHFDGSFATLFPTLAAGGTVVIRPREALLFPRTFFRAVIGEDITYTGFSPSYLRLLLASPQLGALHDAGLDCIALGGEASSLADVEALWAAAPSVRVFNRYGPTETTIAVTHIELTPDLTRQGTIPIGQPHPGVTFHLVDELGHTFDDIERAGELVIGGDQLMSGYWGAPALTAAVLRDDIVPGETVYRTGDLVYRDGAGNFVYVDRVDRVIKRHGVRISLVEVGEALRSLTGVTAAACVAFDQEGETGIAGFVVGDVDEVGDPARLRTEARRLLPDTMLPDRIDVVDDLPMTESSKLDERRLLSGAGLSPPAASPVPPGSSGSA